jgi:transaldolase
MQLFLDTVDIEEIKKYKFVGLVDGVTTNPTLMSKSSESFYDVAYKLCEVVEGDVSLEVGRVDYEGMIEEGKKILDISDNVVIKLPVTFDGVRACRYFSGQGARVNMTLCFSVMQALAAARSGATYISPFIGRLDDIGEDGIKLVSDIRRIYDRYNYRTKILAASIRSISHVEQAAQCGADCITIPAKLMDSLLTHELTTKGLETFKSDWEASGKII